MLIYILFYVNYVIVLKNKRKADKFYLLDVYSPFIEKIDIENPRRFKK